MPVIILFAGILMLLLLITVVKLNAFIALVITSICVGLANKMNLQQLISTVSDGIGHTLGPLVLVLGFGVILGGLLTETGAAQKISTGLIRIFGVKRVKLAMVLTGFTVGIAMFYNAGFIVLIPLVFAVAVSTGQPLVYLTCAMASALSVTHGFLPPHPGPIAIIAIFKADTGRTLLYGFAIAIPTLLVAGILFPEFVKKIQARPPEGMFRQKPLPGDQLPGFGISIFVALIPVLLMGIQAIGELLIPKQSPVTSALKFLGDPGIAMLLAVLMAIICLGVLRGVSIRTLMDRTSSSLNAVAMILLVTAAGGAFKQVLTDSGTGTAIAAWFGQSSLSPLFLGWLIAALIRVSIGSATVAGLTAAGIVHPLIGAMHVNAELMVLSIGAGSLMCSHFNDTGFWMFKEYLGLSIGDTFRSWTLMETIISLMGLAGVMVLHIFV